MKYSNLKERLEDLEQSCSTPPMDKPPEWPLGVCKSLTGDPVQAFALHDKALKWNGDVLTPLSESDDLQWLVVSIGANYTQNAPGPHNNKAPTSNVVANLSSEVKHLGYGFHAYKNDPRLPCHGKCWFEQMEASSASLRIPDQFYFVMTNFCVWITDDKWQNISESIRANLLANNPFFPQPSPTTPPLVNTLWPHLDALFQQLKGHEVLWVGHGLHSEVFALFRLWVKEHGIQNWLLLPNLGSPYNWYCDGKHFPRLEV